MEDSHDQVFGVQAQRDGEKAEVVAAMNSVPVSTYQHRNGNPVKRHQYIPSETYCTCIVNRLQDDQCKGFFSKTFWLITF